MCHKLQSCCYRIRCCLSKTSVCICCAVKILFRYLLKSADFYLGYGQGLNAIYGTEIGYAMQFCL